MTDLDLFTHDEDCDCWNCEGGIYIPFEELEFSTEVSEDLLDTLRELLEPKESLND